ncbi:MAG: 3-keto-disaccharide hydrolase [Acidobacteriota bacterium]
MTKAFRFVFLAWLAMGSIHLASASDKNVLTPNETLELFNGKDLSNFYTWLADYKFEDPHRVFTVVDQVDGAPAIRVSGEHWGGLITNNPYANYHLILEYRWGSVTWGNRKDRTRDNGILLHCQGPEGNAAADFNSPWMKSIEFQIIEGGTGDFILVRGYDNEGNRTAPKMRANVRQDRDGEYVWDPEGQPRTFEGGRINWYGRDPDWKDVLGFRGKQDVEKPVGQWNRLDAFVRGGEFTYLVNGVVVNKGYDANLTEGKLLFQSEGAEIFFRRIELQPLPQQ